MLVHALAFAAQTVRVPKGGGQQTGHESGRRLRRNSRNSRLPGCKGHRMVRNSPPGKLSGIVTVPEGKTADDLRFEALAEKYDLSEESKGDH